MSDALGPGDGALGVIGAFLHGQIDVVGAGRLLFQGQVGLVEDPGQDAGEDVAFVGRRADAGFLGELPNGGLTFRGNGPGGRVA